jgi:hypothetical protein
VHLLQTFSSRQIHLLQQRVIKMWLYPGSSCLNRSFSEELSEAEINTQIHEALYHGANLNPGAGSTPFKEGVAITMVSLFESVFGSLCDFIFLSCS